MSFFPILFFLAIGSLFVSDVFPTNSISSLSFFLTLILPFFLFILTKIERKKINIPVKETFFYLLFMIFSVISTFFAIDKQIAFESLLIYGAGYLFFIFSFNYRKEIRKIVKPLLLVLSIAAVFVFIINSFLKQGLLNESSLLFYSHGHSQMGNLLVLGVTPIFPTILSFLFMIFIIISYSRTAYLALILVIFIRTFKNKRVPLGLAVTLILIVALFYFLISKNILWTKNKETFGARNTYFTYALSSIKEKPFFGVGPGNFYFAAAKKQINYSEGTTSNHDMVLDILSENGVLAGLFFLAFFFRLIYKGKNDDFFPLFLALSFIFMVDFSYRLNTFFILWFVLAGIVLDSKEKIEMKMTFPVIIIFIAAQIIILGQILSNQGYWKQSLMVYPIQKEAYNMAISENINKNDRQQVFYYLEKYNQFFYQSFLAVLNQADYYELLGKPREALLLRKKALELRPLNDINLGKILELSITVQGEKKGKEDFSQLFKMIKHGLNTKKNNDLFRLTNIFCREEKLSCQTSF